MDTKVVAFRCPSGLERTLTKITAELGVSKSDTIRLALLHLERSLANGSYPQGRA
jgi:hypothetical protein